MAQSQGHELYREIRKSEILRTEILMGLFAALLVVFNAVFTFGSPTPGSIASLRILVTSVITVAFLFEFQVRRMIRRHLEEDRPPPAVIRYAGAVVEITLVSLAIWMLTHFELSSPIVSLLMPPSFLYFIFIILSTLRLDFKLSAFTGFVCAAQYFSLYLMFRPEDPLPKGFEPIGNSAHHISKSVLLFFGGVCAGLVARRIRVGAANILRVRGIFGQHVSPAVVDMLLTQKAELASETKHVCVMFVDIRDFTTFSERHSPERVVDYLNTLFASLIDSVNRNNGIVNKFLGDGFMAVFGAPLTDGKDARNALAAAREILAEVERLNAEGSIPPTRVGIGVHAGRVVTGNVGSATRKEYTVIGDTVNVASRIEALNKQFGSCLLVSEDVLIAAGETGTDSKGPMQMKGRTAAIEVFQLG